MTANSVNNTLDREFNLEDGITLCHEFYDGFEIDHCRRFEPCNMPLYHYHDSYEIYYLLSGSRNYFIRDRTYRVEKGDLVLINRHDLHKTSYSGSSSHERILVIFNENYIKPLLQDAMDIDLLQPFHRNINLIHLEPADRLVIEQLLFRMILEVKDKNPGHAFSVKMSLGKLLLDIARRTAHTKQVSADYPDQMHEKISEIIRYIHARYMEKLMLKDISEHFYISLYHLSRLFKRVTGFTFVEFLNSVRIQKAQHLLRTTRLNVGEIAEKTGYESPTHFGRVFKEVTGMSPLKFRKVSR